MSTELQELVKRDGLLARARTLLRRVMNEVAYGDQWPDICETVDAIDAIIGSDGCSEDRCTNPGGHEWNRSAGEADEARLSGDHVNDNIRCIWCGADGDA